MDPSVTVGGRRRASLFFHRDFRLLWGGQSISQVGTMVTLIAMPLLAVRILHASPFEVGLLSTFETLAFLLVGLPAGAWVDRMRRRNVLVVCDTGRALVLGSLPLAAYYGHLTLAQLYAAALVNGVLTVFFDVSYQSYLPVLVGRDHLVEGNAKLQSTESVGMIAGPSVGGLLVQVFTAPYALLVDSLSYLWSAGCVGAIRHREARPERRPDAHLGREIREGLAFVFGHRLLRAIAACTAWSNLMSGATGAMTIVLLARNLDLSAGTIGLLFSGGAVGGVVGALVTRRIAAAVGQGPTIWLSIAVTSPFGLVIPFLHRGWMLGAFVLSQFVTFVGVIVYNVTQVSFRQGLCPDRLLGRMNATMRFVVWGTLPVGGLLGGGLASWLGVRSALLICGIGACVAFLPVYLSPLRTMRDLPTVADGDPPCADGGPDGDRPPGGDLADGDDLVVV